MSDDKPHYDTCNKKTQLNLLLLKKAIVISHSVFQHTTVMILVQY